MTYKNNSVLSDIIRRYYIEILEREPTKIEIQSQLVWMKTNNITSEHLPHFFRESPEFQTLQNFKKIKNGPIQTKDGITMYLNENDHVISRHLAFHKVWEPYETTVTKKFLDKNTIFIDIGANIGYYSLLAGSISKKVLSFEPEKKNFQILSENISVNSFYNITPYNYAITNNIGTSNFYLNTKGNAGDHRFFSDDLLQTNEERVCVQVNCITLDEFCSKNFIEPNIIKMDIQGSEMLALQGMKKILNESKDLVLFTEFWPQGMIATGESPEEFLTKLLDHGFSIFEINGIKNRIDRKSNEQLLQTNKGNSYQYVETNLLCLKNKSLMFPA
jgi:FkbM family methyltransferase